MTLTVEPVNLTFPNAPPFGIPTAPEPPCQPITEPRPTLARTTDHESALITCLILSPEIHEHISQLEPADFAEFGHAEAFEVLRFDYRYIGDLDIGFLLRELRESLGNEVNPAGIVREWITQWVPVWHFRYFASKVAKASYARVVERSLQNGIQEIRFGHSVAEYRQVQTETNQQIEEIENRLKDWL